jgi:hypothetical protein
MPNKIERLSAATPVITATNSTSTSPKIAFGAVAGGVMFVTAVSSATKVTWHAAIDASATPLPLYADGAVVETAVAANRAYPVPDAAFAAPFIVAVTDAGTATIQITVKG